MATSNKILELDENYVGEITRGFIIELGEGVTPQQVNLCVLKRFFSKLPNNDCIRYIRRQTERKLFVAVQPGEHADAFFNAIAEVYYIEGFPVEIDVPPQLRYTLRVITHPELKYLTPAELQELLADVPDINYFNMKPNSSSAILGFELQESCTPSTVTLGWDKVNCRPLKQLPVRCYKCQKYGHQAGACRSETRCSRCSLPGHDHTACSATSPTCAACGGDHDVYSNKCPEWIKRKKTYAAATKIDKKQTYAAATKTNKKEETVPTTAAQQEAIQPNTTRQPMEKTSTSTPCKPPETTKRTTNEETWTTIKTKKTKK